jgi:flagella basal body P-ring formation protein FlgA
MTRTLALLHALLLLGAMVLALAQAQAATLRPLASLDGPTVRLSDLFDGLAVSGDRALGPAPPPGGRIVVEAPQLAAIARQFGVDWRPANAAERSVLERPGRPLPRDVLIGALREALAGAGAPADGDLELPGYAAPLIPPQAAPRCDIEQLDYDTAGSGRFTAQLVVSAAGMGMQRLRLAGVWHEVADLPVAAHRLLAGVAIGTGDLTTARVRLGNVRGEVARAAEQIVGKAPRRMIGAGQPLVAAELTAPLVVQRGARVLMELTTPGLAVAAQGQALAAGTVGERITVLNPNSRAVVEAEVVGPNHVRVAPGSSPLSAPGLAAANAAGTDAMVLQ